MCLVELSDEELVNIERNLDNELDHILALQNILEISKADDEEDFSIFLGHFVEKSDDVLVQELLDLIPKDT